MLVFCLFGHRKIDERQQVVFVGKWDKLSILFIGNKWRETNCCMNLARHSDLVPQSPAFSACLYCFTRGFIIFLILHILCNYVKDSHWRRWVSRSWSFDAMSKINIVSSSWCGGIINSDRSFDCHYLTCYFVHRHFSKDDSLIGTPLLVIIASNEFFK